MSKIGITQVGKILPKIGYIYQGSDRTVTSAMTGGKVECIDTIVFNPHSSQKSLKKKLDMMKHSYRGKWGVIFSKIEDNTPFRVRILNIVANGTSCTRYIKVINSKGYHLELREDQLLEAMKLGKIDVGGHIETSFIWCTSGNETKMCAVGGELYNKCVEEEELNRARVLIERTAITPGCVLKYTSHKKGYTHLFIGTAKWLNMSGVETVADVFITNYEHIEYVMQKGTKPEELYYCFDAVLKNKTFKKFDTILEIVDAEKLEQYRKFGFKHPDYRNKLYEVCKKLKISSWDATQCKPARAIVDADPQLKVEWI